MSTPDTIMADAPELADTEYLNSVPEEIVGDGDNDICPELVRLNPTDFHNADYLSAMPQEIVDQICSYLDRSDLINIRQTCSRLTIKSMRQFGLDVFTTVQITLTTKSLQDLVKISEHEQFSRCVRRLEISQWAFAKIGLPFQCDSVPSKGSRHPQRQVYRKYFHQQCTLRKQGLDHQALEAALRRLPALHSIALVSDINFDKPPRIFNKVRREIGINTPDHDKCFWRQDRIVKDRDTKATEHHSVLLVLGAIVQSGIELKGTLDLGHRFPKLKIPKTHTSRRKSATPAFVFALEDREPLRRALFKLKKVRMFEALDQANVPTDGHSFDWVLRLHTLWPSSFDSLDLRAVCWSEFERRLSRLLVAPNRTNKATTPCSLECTKPHIPNLRRLFITTIFGHDWYIPFPTQNLILSLMTNHRKTLERLTMDGVAYLSRSNFNLIMTEILSLERQTSLELKDIFEDDPHRALAVLRRMGLLFL